MDQRDRAKRGYHHGNLREALLFAAIGLIADKGLQGFTFAEAARAAGVSPAAPYRHFADRDALIAEVARYGFERFADRLERAWNRGAPSPLAALEAVGLAYLAFAREERPLFQAMFQSGVPEDPAVKSAADRAFAVLQGACQALAATRPVANRPPVHMMTYHLWALCHGVAELFGDRPPRRAPISAADLLESGLLVYLRGLGLIPED
ncbi:MAG: TetR/AcrR family transcriptional regulator [Alphaproteobacteria bacterium]|nr:TetR/AcrR family transcriptional regulator [Alphaproteobacteria bacterium]